MSTLNISWDRLLDGQRELDKYISERNDLSALDISQSKLLALCVELSELANTTKAFKFWSKSSPDEVGMLEEYVDVLHFILSISLDKGYSLSEIVFNSMGKKSKKELVDIFLHLNSTTSDLSTEEGFKKWVQNFLDLASCLGFTLSQVELAYWNKRQKNLDRQDRNY